MRARPGRRGEDDRNQVEAAAARERFEPQYRLPADLDLDRYSTAVVWCRAFSVLFARAPTRA